MLRRELSLWRRNACAIRVRFAHTYLFFRAHAPTTGRHDRCSSAPRRLRSSEKLQGQTLQAGIIDRFVIILSRELFLRILLLLENQESCEWKYECAGDRGELSLRCNHAYQCCTNQITIPRKSLRNSAMPFNYIARQETRIFSH